MVWQGRWVISSLHVYIQNVRVLLIKVLKLEWDAISGCFVSSYLIIPVSLIVGTEWGWEQLQSRGLKHTQKA